jgi:hypothetical protein
MVVIIKTEMTFGTYNKDQKFVPSKDAIFDCPMMIEDISFYIGDKDSVAIYTIAGVKLISSMSKEEFEDAILDVLHDTIVNNTDDELYIPTRCIYWYNFITQNRDNRLENNSSKGGIAPGASL